MAEEPKKEENLDFLKEFTDVPPPPVLKRSRLGLSVQFFVVPSVIVGICVGIFLLFRFMTEETQTLPDLFERTVHATGRQKAVYAVSFIHKLTYERGDFANPAPPELQKMAPLILTAARQLSGRELQEEEINFKVICMKALAIIGNPDVAPDIARIMEEEKNEIVHWEGLQTLGALKNPESAGVIRKYLSQSSGKTRKYAAFNLGALRLPETIPDLQKSLADESAEVRWNSAFSLAYFLHDKSGVPVLLRMLNRSELGQAIDAKEPYRDDFIDHAMSMAAQGLAVVREASAVPILKDVAEHDPSPAVQAACRDALKQIEPK